MPLNIKVSSLSLDAGGTRLLVLASDRAVRVFALQTKQRTLGDLPAQPAEQLKALLAVRVRGKVSMGMLGSRLQEGDGGGRLHARLSRSPSLLGRGRMPSEGFEPVPWPCKQAPTTGLPCAEQVAKGFAVLRRGGSPAPPLTPV